MAINNFEEAEKTTDRVLGKVLDATSDIKNLCFIFTRYKEYTKELQEENERLQTELDKKGLEYTRHYRKEIRRLRNALRFYANEENGHKARLVLLGDKNE